MSDERWYEDPGAGSPARGIGVNPDRRPAVAGVGCGRSSIPMTILITFFVGVQLFLGACALVYLVGRSAANPAPAAAPTPVPAPMAAFPREVACPSTCNQAVAWAHHA